jgi:hypothetical protein
MAKIRYKAIFPRDLNSSIIQKSLSKFTRIGVIQSVDSTKGVCTIKWADHPGIRTDVIITQANSGEWHMPDVGSVVLVAFDQYDRARIIRYINIGQATKITQKTTLPRLKAGEKLWEGPVGSNSYLYMKKNGDIVLATASQSFITIENGTSTVKSESANWKVITDGGISYFGIVQRMVPDPLTGSYNSKAVTDLVGNNYIEYHFQILEFGNGAVGITGVSDPLIDITLGTSIDINGNPVAKNGSTTVPVISPTKQVTIGITLKNGVSIFIDKEGRASINAKSFNFNAGSADATDSDVALGLETNNPTLGSRGQHVAREHDNVTIPLTTVYTDINHLDVPKVAISNVVTLEQLAQAFISPVGPCVFNPLMMPASSSLQGVITSGANNILAGDS